jgi:hypothetical protein
MRRLFLGLAALGLMAMTPLPPEGVRGAPAPALAPFPSTRGKPVVISLERTACFGRCPIYRVEIRGDGLVTYQGERFVAVTGRRTRRISPAAVRRLMAQFQAANFFALRDEYRAGMTDMPSRIVTLQIGGRGKRVVDYVGEEVGMPHSVTELEQAIDRVAGTAAWVGAR